MKLLPAACTLCALFGCTTATSGPARDTATSPAAATSPSVSPVAALPTQDPEAYLLPFPRDVSSPVGQGSFGVGGIGSHVGEYAIDFVIPERTPVLAARGGVVTQVRQDCPNVNCPFDPERCCGNYIRIRHADGTTAAYWHLVQYGSCVNVGDQVARGDVIGRSGNTGMSLTPHLHFAVFAARGDTGTGRYGNSRDNSMEVRFADVPCDGVPVFLGIYTSQNAKGVDHCPG